MKGNSMKINKKTLLLLFLIAYVTPVLSQVQVSAYMVTHYVWRGFDVLGGGPAFQPSVTYTCPKFPVSANIWTSWAMTHRAEESIRNLDEIDFTVSYDYTSDKVGLSAGIIHYDYPNMDNWPDKFSTDPEIFMGITMKTVRFSPKLTVFYALNEDAWKGTYILASASHSIPSESLPIDCGFSLGYSDQSLVTNITDTGISDINLSLSSTIKTCCHNLTPSFTLTYVPDDMIYSEGLIFWGGLKIDKTF